jgi:hypothetical protein
MKRPNWRIMGIEGEQVQAKGIHNIFHKIITENFPNLEKVLLVQVQEASRTPNRLDQNRTSPWDATFFLSYTWQYWTCELSQSSLPIIPSSRQFLLLPP